MRHHHELPLTGVMELRPDHEAPPHNHCGIKSWPMRHHHETIVKLRHDRTKNMSHQPIIKLSCIPISFQYIINHPTTFHTHIMPSSSIPAHTIKYYMHIHILHTLNRVIQTKLTINNQSMEKNNHRENSRTSLAQARDPRSGTKDLSLKLHVLT